MNKTASTPLLLVPGLLCNEEIFADQVPALTPIASVTIANHMHGDSMTSMARAILANAPPRFALAGFSMGGYLSFEIFRQAPERIDRLALIDTAARPDSPDHIKLRRERIEMTRQGRFEEIIPLHHPFLVHRRARENPIIRERFLTMARNYGADAYIRHLVATLQRPDSRPTLASIRCPTLIVVGDDDRVTPPEWSEEIAAGIPHAQKVVLKECGHMSPFEQPDTLNARLIDWLTS